MSRYRPLASEDCRVGIKYQEYNWNEYILHNQYDGTKRDETQGWCDREIKNEVEAEKIKRRLPDEEMFSIRILKSLDVIKALEGKIIILRRKMFIGNNPHHDVECTVLSAKEKSVMCKLKTETVFIPMKFFFDDRSELVVPEGKPIIHLPNWFHF